MTVTGIDVFSSFAAALSQGIAQGGCFADTTILFSATYPLDLFNEQSEMIFELIAPLKIPIFTNVNVRAEFLESHRRVLVAECLIELLEDRESALDGPILEKLKAHRTSYRRKVAEEKTAKMDVGQIKLFRRLLSGYEFQGRDGWDLFCRDYLQKRLAPIWEEAETEFELNFISLRSDDETPFLNSRPEWSKAVDLMGRYGIASADAMILNMFLCSKIPVLLTADVEMAECAVKESKGAKRVFIPDSALGA